MATTTVTTQPDRTEDTARASHPVYEVRVLVEDSTRITAQTAQDHAWTTIGQIGACVTIAEAGCRTADDGLDLLERFYCRALTAVSEARQRLFVERLAELPCAGVCNPATWAHASTWVCSEPDGEFTCGREEGHDGDHLACTVDAHAAHRWPTGKAEAR